MAKRAKSLARMTVEELYDLEDKHSVHIGGNRVPPPDDYWLIMTFFVAAAVRKGATDLPKRLKRDPRSQVVQDGRNYRIESHFNESKHASTFTVYSDGQWAYNAGKTRLKGKLQPPHSTQWLPKLLAKGTPGEIARQDLEQYKMLRKVRL